MNSDFFTDGSDGRYGCATFHARFMKCMTENKGTVKVPATLETRYTGPYCGQVASEKIKASVLGSIFVGTPR